MNTAQQNNLQNLLTLKQAAEKLQVPVETLLLWNQNNILKPTITPDGQVGYAPEQINQFLTIRQLIQTPTQVQPGLTHTPQVPLLPASPVGGHVLPEDAAFAYHKS